MVNVYDVDQNKLVEALAAELKKVKGLQMPEWAKFVKTGAHKERPPEQKDWWYLRSAAILRNVYLNGPVGVERLRTRFGGRKNRGHKPERKVKASGKIIRTILQQLESEELIKKQPKGRVITPKGMKLVDNIAHKVLKG